MILSKYDLILIKIDFGIDRNQIVPQNDMFIIIIILIVVAAALRDGSLCAAFQVIFLNSELSFANFLTQNF